MSKTFARTLGFSLALALAAVAKGDVILFEGTLNTTPNAQGWLYLTNPVFGSSATQTPSSTGTTLDSSVANSDQAGYFARLGGFAHPLMPTLDRASGYSVSFDLAVLAESHTSANRAGFSLIVLSQDLKGIELGFWTDQVWAQADSPLFTKAETAVRDTTSMTSYLVTVLGGSYTLSANGTTLLTGALRDYSSFGTPYTTPSFLFLGDDTSSAGGRAKLARVGVTVASVPEPGAWRLFTLGTGGVVATLRLGRRRLNPGRRRDR